jgi:hypothetical protein
LIAELPILADGNLAHLASQLLGHAHGQYLAAFAFRFLGKGQRPVSQRPSAPAVIAYLAESIARPVIASSDLRRRSARCTDCGAKGAILQHPERNRLSDSSASLVDFLLR